MIMINTNVLSERVKLVHCSIFTIVFTISKILEMFYINLCVNNFIMFMNLKE